MINSYDKVIVVFKDNVPLTGTVDENNDRFLTVLDDIHGHLHTIPWSSIKQTISASAFGNDDDDGDDGDDPEGDFDPDNPSFMRFGRKFYFVFDDPEGDDVE